MRRIHETGPIQPNLRRYFGLIKQPNNSIRSFNGLPPQAVVPWYRRRFCITEIQNLYLPSLRELSQRCTNPSHLLEIQVIRINRFQHFLCLGFPP